MQRSRLATITLSMVAAMVATLTWPHPPGRAERPLFALGDTPTPPGWAPATTPPRAAPATAHRLVPALYAANVRPASYRSSPAWVHHRQRLSSQVAALSANTTLVSITVAVTTSASPAS